jgi:hypothetical protein
MRGFEVHLDRRKARLTSVPLGILVPTAMDILLLVAKLRMSARCMLERRVCTVKICT